METKPDPSSQPEPKPQTPPSSPSPTPPPTSVMIDLGTVAEPEPAPLPQPKSAATATAEPPVPVVDDRREELVLKLRTLLQGAFSTLEELRTGEAAEATDELGQELQALRLELDAEDVILSYDVRITARTGEVSRLKGHTLLHGFVADRALAESPENFETVLYASVFRPMKSRVQEFLNTFVKNDNPVPAGATLAPHVRNDLLPGSGPKLHIAGS